MVRRLALQGLCCLDVQGGKALDAMNQFIADSDESLDTVVAARELMLDTFDDRPEIDAMLARHARRWDLPRLALVDRNILRMSVHELKGKIVPPKVIINEALKLARDFSTAESPRFINGVLDAVLKELQKQD